MDTNISDVNANVTLDQVIDYFNLNISEVNQSEVAQIHLFDLYEAYRTIEREQLMVYKSVAYVIGTLIILSNLTVVISSGLILRKGQQPKSTYLLLGNVSLADTIIGIGLIFGVTVDNSASSNRLCIFQMGMLVCPAMVSIFSVGLIAVDRYIYILHGLYYQRWFNTTRVRIGILIIWMIGITLGFMPATGWVNTELISTRCYYVALFPGSLILLNSFLSIVPIALVAVLYTKILVEALKTVRTLNTGVKNTKTSTPTPDNSQLRMYRGSKNDSESVKIPGVTCSPQLPRSSSFHIRKPEGKSVIKPASSFQFSSSNDLIEKEVDTRNTTNIIMDSKHKTSCGSVISICTIESSVSDTKIADLKNSKFSCSVKKICNINKVIRIFISMLPAMGWTGRSFRNFRCWYIAVFPSALLLILSIVVLSVIIMVCLLYILILRRAVKTADKIKEFKENSYTNKGFTDDNSSSTVTSISENSDNIKMKKMEKETQRSNCSTIVESKKSGCCWVKSANHLSKLKAVKTVLIVTLCFLVYKITEFEYRRAFDGLKMARLLICVVVCLISAALGDRHDKYEGHQLYRVSGTQEQITELEGHLDLLSLTPAVRSTSGKLEALLRLSPEEKSQWLEYFQNNGMPYKKVADNLAAILRQEETDIKRARSQRSRSIKSAPWEDYYRFDEINEYLDELGVLYPDLVTVINADLSYEYRQIKYVKISTTRFEDLKKPVIVIDAMVHAREWVTTPVALYIINQLVVDIVDRQLTESFDWVIIPLANPDGYEYSMVQDRMWRKTRSRSHPLSDECPGVDGNRNFDHYFGTTASSSNPCSIIYEGPSPFSESEIRVIRNVVLANLKRTALYISLHSYGNMFLYAWGNNGTLPSNGIALHLTGIQMATAIDALARPEAPRYLVGNAAQVLYYTTGTSRDWTRSVGIPLTYTLELPGYDYGFLVPPTYIKQIVTETWAGIAAGAKYILRNY
ncbi:unnamed protein product [Arctia plantaginis]|uniref:G-protein coupled receptors family 1 profile domain-containing protein n=1 Tax=Arctia plantaginis TaxID=874455 RepID=A0A8S1AVQ6_ARCPL|nr:unnamed protein product [Arctia plantaginis]